MDRRKPGDVLFYALQCAKSDRVAFMDAYSHDDSFPEVVEAQKDIRAFARLQLALFGTTRSAMDAALEKMKPISLHDLRNLVGANPEFTELFDTHEEIDDDR